MYIYIAYMRDTPEHVYICTDPHTHTHTQTSSVREHIYIHSIHARYTLLYSIPEATAREEAGSAGDTHAYKVYYKLQLYQKLQRLL
jgi:hypothetical protein